MGKGLNNSVSLYEELIKLQNIKDSEKVVIVTEPVYARENPTIVYAFQTALSNLGTDFYTMTIPPRAKNILLDKPGTDFIFDSLKGANFILTLGAMIIYGTDEGYELLKSGKRSLHNSIDENTLRRLWPTERIINRTFEGAKIMHDSKIIKVTSKKGTDLTVDKTGRKAHSQCSLAHIPGRWDNAGYGRVDAGPPYNFAEGTIIFDSGDYIQPMDRIVESPIKCTVKNGYVVNIEGGADAKMFKMWLDYWEDPECYRVSHIGWGTNDGAIWYGRGITPSADRYNYYGSVTIAMGSNTFRSGAKYSGFDIKIDAAAHCDNIFLNNSLWLDDIQILDEGKHVNPKLI